MSNCLRILLLLLRLLLLLLLLLLALGFSDTWAKAHSNQLLFLVAGLWTAERDSEFAEHDDLLHLHIPERYAGEASSLHRKTFALAHVVRKHVADNWSSESNSRFYVLKTDDDANILVDEAVGQAKTQGAQYWGKTMSGIRNHETGVYACEKAVAAAYTSGSKSWGASWFPPYNSGAAYIFSGPQFVTCIDETVSTFGRVCGIEDQTMGIVANACGIKAHSAAHYGRLVRHHLYHDSPEELSMKAYEADRRKGISKKGK